VQGSTPDRATGYILGILSDLFFLSFQTRAKHVFFISVALATCLGQIIHLNFISGKYVVRSKTHETPRYKHTIS